MTDFILDDTMDLALSGGDFRHGDATRQHQKLLILLSPGELRESPTVGVGALGFILEEDGFQAINGDIKRAFENDGMTVRAINVNQAGRLQIDAAYA